MITPGEAIALQLCIERQERHSVRGESWIRAVPPVLALIYYDGTALAASFPLTKTIRVRRSKVFIRRGEGRLILRGRQQIDAGWLLRT